MNYYFLPRHPIFETAVTLANFASVDVMTVRSQFVHMAWTDGQRWHVAQMGEIGPGECRSFTSSALPDSVPGDRACFFFLYFRPLPETLDRLPSDAIMETAPAWRGNIQFRSATSRTSYQGEYPGGMLKLKRQSLVSISPMMQGGAGVHMHFMLANLCETPEIRECSLRFARIQDRKTILTAKVRTNDVSLVDLTAITPENAGMFCTISRDITGVPLYLAFDEAGIQLSLEHTHPPTELFVFSRAPHVPVKRMKNWWLAQVAP